LIAETLTITEPTARPIQNFLQQPDFRLRRAVAPDITYVLYMVSPCRIAPPAARAFAARSAIEFFAASVRACAKTVPEQGC
jgi:hypothetical protein